MNSQPNITIDVGSAEDLRHILEISGFVEFVLGGTQGRDLLWVLERQVGNCFILFCELYQYDELC